MDTTTREQTAANMVTSFLDGWNRHDWMQEHGDWASSRWDAERAEYDGALVAARDSIDAIADTLADAPIAERADADSLDIDSAIDSAQDIIERLERLRAACAALDGSVSPDGGDYIAEGTIDPDDVAGECHSECRVGGDSWRGWDCTEGWAAYLLPDGRVVANWWRSAEGQRHERDLWILVDHLDGDDCE